MTKITVQPGELFAIGDLAPNLKALTAFNPYAEYEEYADGDNKDFVDFRTALLEGGLAEITEDTSEVETYYSNPVFKPTSEEMLRIINALNDAGFDADLVTAETLAVAQTRTDVGMSDEDYYGTFMVYLKENPTQLKVFIETVRIKMYELWRKEKAQEFGYAMTGVGAGEGHPQYVYTIGLCNKHGIELFCACSQPSDLLSKIVGGIAQRYVDGDPLPLGEIPEYLKGPEEALYPIRLVACSRDLLDTLPMVSDNPQLVTSVIQIQIPDVNRKFPGEEGYDNTFTQVDHSATRVLH